jgi:hypothetical protein
MTNGLLEDTVDRVFSAGCLHEEGHATGTISVNRHDTALRRHEPLAFMQRDRCERERIAEPRQRMIAKAELQVAFHGHDRRTGSQIVHADLAGGEVRRRSGRSVKRVSVAGLTYRHDWIPFNRFHVIQLIESVRMKTATAFDDLNRYRRSFWLAVSVGIGPICICRDAQTARTIGS